MHGAACQAPTVLPEKTIETVPKITGNTGNLDHNQDFWKESRRSCKEPHFLETVARWATGWGLVCTSGMPSSNCVARKNHRNSAKNHRKHWECRSKSRFLVRTVGDRAATSALTFDQGLEDRELAREDGEEHRHREYCTCVVATAHPQRRGLHLVAAAGERASQPRRRSMARPLLLGVHSLARTRGAREAHARRTRGACHGRRTRPLPPLPAPPRRQALGSARGTRGATCADTPSPAWRALARAHARRTRGAREAHARRLPRPANTPPPSLPRPPPRRQALGQCARHTSATYADTRTQIHVFQEDSW